MATKFRIHPNVNTATVLRALNGLPISKKASDGRTIELPGALTKAQRTKLQGLGEFIGKPPRIQTSPMHPNKDGPLVMRFEISHDRKLDLRRLKATLFGLTVLGRNIGRGQVVHVVFTDRLTEGKRQQLLKFGRFAPIT